MEYSPKRALNETRKKIINVCCSCVSSLSPHRAYKKQEVIGRFSVGRVGPVGRVGRYHAGRICARPTGPIRPTTHKQNLSGLRTTPALKRRLSN